MSPSGQARLTQSADRQRQIGETIAETPAGTMHGLRAKLAIVEAEPDWAGELGITESAMKDMQRIDAAARLATPAQI